MMLFLLEYREFFIGAHIIGVIGGVGAVTVTDFLFFRFLKDFRIQADEVHVLRKMSFIIWCALGSILITGIALYLPMAAALNATPKFLALHFTATAPRCCGWTAGTIISAWA